MLILWEGIFHFVCRDKTGKILWEESCTNNLFDEGEQSMLDVYFRGSSAPTSFYIRLYNNTPVETNTLSGLTGEPTGNGYASLQIEKSTVGWPTMALESGDYQLTSKTVTFTASGGSIGPVTYAVLATSTDNTGLLIAATALSQSRTILDGGSLDVTYKVKLK